jgi:1,4-alpha-glucan branching enzyme
LSGIEERRRNAMSTKTNKDGSVSFVCEALGGARQVSLVGDFNGWAPDVRRMVKGKDGTFRARVELEPGQYQYKFVVDGDWRHDPTADAQVANQYGTLNSVVTA